MTPADLNSLLAPVSADDPCGANLEYDAAFTELERIAVGKPEQQVGSTIVAAEDPDWIEVEKKARALLARSKDLRVATHLTKALLRTKGLAGFAGGVALIRELLDQHWAAVHPRLDPDDHNDPTARLNVLAGLADPATVNGFRTAPIISSSRAVGRLSLRDVEMAAGEVAPPTDGSATAPASMSMIEGAAGETDLGALVETSSALAGAAAALTAIENLVADKVGGGDSVDFGRLPAMLRKAHGVVDGWISSRAPVAADGEPAAPRASASTRSTGEISSREDVIRALDRIIAYYSRYEPSSPIPVLIERCNLLFSICLI
jgi:type VI secretion system protein ImpA